ncbi:hypothetical protein LNQ52_31935 [Klebsiella pneumoniae subsp. pneumoniae]|nr:hypothetical protein [Klebsiella pneumoniae subsp. pneumoniae]
MFASPADTDPRVAENPGVEGANRFLKRVWKLVCEHTTKGEVAALNVAALSEDRSAASRYPQNHRQSDRRHRPSSDLPTPPSAAIVEALMNKLASAAGDEQDRALMQEALLAVVRYAQPRSSARQLRPGVKAERPKAYRQRAVSISG